MKKRDLFEEMKISHCADSAKTPIDIEISKIKNMVDSKIKADLSSAERKYAFMKTKKKIAFIAVAATLVLGLGVFATSGMIDTWYSHSSSKPTYVSLPTAEECIKDIGYAPALIETFENGYAFLEGSLVNNVLRDENDNTVEKFKSVTFRYEKDGDRVIFSQDKFVSQTEVSGDVIANSDGVDVYYHSYVGKSVPPDYKMTDEDKKAEKNGELVFSWGSEKVEIIKVQSVIWTEGNMHYSLMQMDGKLSPEELAQMALEVIAE